MSTIVRVERRAFTLIELLVVIAIIAILAAILFPVFAQAREKARAISCLSNCRQIGMGLYMYIEDYDEKYPEEHPADSNPAVDDNQGQLENVDYGSPFDKILPYVDSRYSNKTALYVCPDDPDPHGLAITTMTSSGYICTNTNPPGPPPGPLTSFLLNAYYLFGATLADIDTPTQSVYIAERRSEGKITDFCDVHYHPWLGEVELPTGPNDTMDPIAIESMRHSGLANYVYSDGHAKARQFAATRAPFTGHLLFGEHQAF